MPNRIVMFLKLIFSLLFVSCYVQLAAQVTISEQVDNDYRQFRDVFDKEINNTDNLGDINKLTIHPASLPEWLTSIPVSTNKSVYAIGISDPGMDEMQANLLAVLRAKTVIALLVSPKISSLTDNYSKEQKTKRTDQFTTKYVNYYRILASLNGNPEQFEVVEKYTSSFGEVIVLMKYTPDILTKSVIDSLMFKIDYYQAERQLKNKFEFEEKCEVYGLSKQNNGSEEIDLFYYYFRAVNQFSEIVSRFNGEELGFPQTIFRYQSLMSTSADKQSFILSYKLNYGLWKAFVDSLIQKITSETINPDVSMQRLGDNYSSSSQDLSREVSESDPVFRIQGIQVSNNRLSLMLNRMN